MSVVENGAKEVTWTGEVLRLLAENNQSLKENNEILKQDRAIILNIDESLKKSK